MQLSHVLRCAASAGYAPLPSALYQSGRSAQRVVTILRPCLDDALDERRLPALRNSLQRRRTAAGPPLDRLVRDWRCLQALEAQRDELARQRAEVARRGAELRRGSGQCSDEEQQQLRQRGAELKRAAQRLQPALWQLQENVLPRLARLPNTLDPLTPDVDRCEPVLAADVPPPVPVGLPSGEEEPLFGAELLHTPEVASGAYFLHGAAAAAELALLEYACDALQHAGYERVSCPDTVKSLVAEGCGLAFESPAAVARLAHWHEAGSGGGGGGAAADTPLRLHLVGGASLPALCALLAKSRQPSSALPLRLAAAGRLYGPPRPWTAGQLPPQSAAVRHLTACAGPRSAAREFDASLQLLERLCAALGVPAHVRHVSATRLAGSERRRCELQLRAADGRPVTVAHVSAHGDYIGRRLHAVHAPPTAARCRPLHVVEGCALLVPPVLHVLMGGGGGGRLVSWPAALVPFVDTVWSQQRPESAMPEQAAAGDSMGV